MFPTFQPNLGFSTQTGYPTANAQQVTQQAYPAVQQAYSTTQQAQPAVSTSSYSFTAKPPADPFKAKPVYASSGGMSNPYLGQQANAITNQLNQNLQNNILPGVASGAMAAGGYGGSRHGIAQGLAMGQTQQGIANSLAGMYGSAYQHDQDLANQREIAIQANEAAARNAQIAADAAKYGYDRSAETARMNNETAYKLGMGNLGLGYQNSDNAYKLGIGNLGLGFHNSGNAYDLGLRSNDLGFATLDANINNQNFNNQLQGANFGLNVYNALQGNNNLGLTAGTNIQNTPLNYYSQLANVANSIGSGYGTTTGTSQAAGNPVLGALGGAQLGGSIDWSKLFS